MIKKKGIIEVYYTSEFITLDEGPFLKEERSLIVNLAGLITGYLNTVSAKHLVLDSSVTKEEPFNDEEENEVVTSKQLLQKFLNKNNANRDIYHDLMPFKVKEILLVANLYDAYSIEKEGRFSEHVLGEYQQLNLTSIPKITGVSAPQEAVDALKNKHYDMVIFNDGRR